MLGKIFLTALNAIVPIVALIALGWLLRRVGFLDQNFIKRGSQLVFKICLPCMLFVNIYDIESFEVIRWDVVIYCLTMVAVIFGLSFLVCAVTTKDPRKRGVIWQSGFRSNFAIIGLPLASALGGTAGEGVAAVLSAFAIPAFNIFGVMSLTACVGEKKSGIRALGQFFREVITNPLILGVAAGLVALLLRGVQETVFGQVVYSVERDTPFLYKILSNLKAITSPFALIVLGGQCEFKAAGGMLKEILVGTLWRIVGTPLIAIGTCVFLSCCTNLLHCGNGEYAAMIAVFGSPVAVTSAIVAGAMGADEQLATQLVVWTSVGSVITIFLQVCLLMGFGLLTPV